jgi:hypothetical protein
MKEDIKNKKKLRNKRKYLKVVKGFDEKMKKTNLM